MLWGLRREVCGRGFAGREDFWSEKLDVSFKLLELINHCTGFTRKCSEIKDSTKHFKSCSR